MQAEFENLASLLRRRLELIADHDWRDRDPDAHLEALKEVSEEIVIVRENFPGKIPPRLDHFLIQCSYDKALAFLEEESSGS